MICFIQILVHGKWKIWDCAVYTCHLCLRIMARWDGILMYSQDFRISASATVCNWPAHHRHADFQGLCQNALCETSCLLLKAQGEYPVSGMGIEKPINSKKGEKASKLVGVSCPSMWERRSGFTFNVVSLSVLAQQSTRFEYGIKVEVAEFG